MSLLARVRALQSDEGSHDSATKAAAASARAFAFQLIAGLEQLSFVAINPIPFRIAWQVFKPVFALWFGGQESDGGVMSFTCTVKLQLAVFPELSFAR